MKNLIIYLFSQGLTKKRARSEVQRDQMSFCINFQSAVYHNSAKASS